MSERTKSFLEVNVHQNLRTVLQNLRTVLQNLRTVLQNLCAQCCKTYERNFSQNIKRTCDLFIW